VPEKAFAKFADRMQYLMSALAAAAATQGLVGGVSSTQPMNRGAAIQAASTSGAPALTKEAVEEKLQVMLDEAIEESNEEVKVIYFGTKRSFKLYDIAGIWIQKKPFLLFIEHERESHLKGGLVRKVFLRAVKNSAFLLTAHREVTDGTTALNVNKLFYAATSEGGLEIFNSKMCIAALLFYCGGCCAISCCPATCGLDEMTAAHIFVKGKKYSFSVKNAYDFYVNGIPVLKDRCALPYSVVPPTDKSSKGYEAVEVTPNPAVVTGVTGVVTGVAIAQPSNSSKSTAKDFVKAWEVISSEGKTIDKAATKKALDELGVESADDLGALSDEELSKLSELLKPVGKRAWNSALGF
jgi:hypothetical protein